MSLLRRGLRARRRLHAALLAAASLTISAAVVSGVFGAAAEESVVRDRLAQAPFILPLEALPTLAPAEGGVRLEGVSGGLYDNYPAPMVPALLRQRPSDGRWSAFPHGITMIQTVGNVTLTPVLDAQTTQFVWRDGFCAHVRVVAGRCAAGPHGAMISSKTAAAARSTLLGQPLQGDPVSGLRIVGVYRPLSIDDRFWFGGTYFQGDYTADGDEAQFKYPDRTSLDAVLVTKEGFLRSPGVEAVHVTVDYPLDPDATDATGGSLRAQLQSMRRAVRTTPFQVRTTLESVIDSARPQQRYLVEGARFVALQLIVLGLVVLFVIMRDIIEGRRREVALAKLRGQSAFSVARFALEEPLVVLIAAVPIGLLTGLVAGLVLAVLLLRPGTPVGLPPSAFGAAALTLAGSAAAAVLSALQVTNRPVLEQWSRVEHRRKPGLLLRSAVTFGCFGLAWGVFRYSDRGGQAASAVVLEPVLLIAAVAVLGVPAAGFVAQATAHRSRGTSRYARFFAVRRLARERAAPRTATLLVVALGLATFAAGGQSVLVGNRQARAEAELGAPTVVPVTYDGVHDPVAAVRRADPRGEWAAAVARWLPDGGDTVTGEVLGLQPAQLRRFGLPVRGGISTTALARAVDATSAPSIVVTGTRFTAVLDVEHLAGSAPSTVRPVLTDPNGNRIQPVAGTMRIGVHEYTTIVPCTRGCRFLGFVWDRPPKGVGRLSGTVTVRGLSERAAGRRRPLDAHLGDRIAWSAATPVSEATDEVSRGATGVVDVFSTSSGYGGLQYSSTMRVLPVVSTVSGMVAQPPPTGFAMSDEFTDSQPIRRVGTAPLLPAVLDDGLVVDLDAADRNLANLVVEARWSVWLSPSAPPDALQRLDRAGLLLGAPVSLKDRELAFARQAPGLSFGLLLALAIVAAVLAVLATAIGAASTARSRAREAASMRMIGVPARAIVAAAVLEQVLLLGTAAVLALPAGVLSVLLVMPRLREFATATPVPQVFVPSVLSVLLLAIVFVVAVAVTGGIAAVSVVRAAGPQRLREVEA